MKDRLQEILTKEHLTPARFAELVGVQRSSVSHILSGRNKPSLDFIQKILTHFGHINPDWLITGKGFYKRQAIAPSDEKDRADSTRNFRNGRINFPASPPVEDEDPFSYGSNIPDDEKAKGSNSDAPVPPKDPDMEAPASVDQSAEGIDERDINKRETSPVKGKSIIKTVFFYTDNTFEVFYPTH
ncbi:MAG: helix-turn-helix transcriptional regulator [Marinilabilia sp.]